MHRYIGAQIGSGDYTTVRISRVGWWVQLGLVWTVVLGQCAADVPMH